MFCILFEAVGTAFSVTLRLLCISVVPTLLLTLEDFIADLIAFELPLELSFELLFAKSPPVFAKLVSTFLLTLSFASVKDFDFAKAERRASLASLLLCSSILLRSSWASDVVLRFCVFLST